MQKAAHHPKKQSEVVMARSKISGTEVATETEGLRSAYMKRRSGLKSDETATHARRLHKDELSQKRKT